MSAMKDMIRSIVWSSPEEAVANTFGDIEELPENPRNFFDKGDGEWYVHIEEQQLFCFCFIFKAKKWIKLHFYFVMKSKRHKRRAM